MLRSETIYRLHRTAAARYRCQQSAGFSGLMESVRWWAATELEIRHFTEVTDVEMITWRLFLANVGDLHCEPMRPTYRCDVVGKVRNRAQFLLKPDCLPKK